MSIAKPSTGAFVLKKNMVDVFFAKKDNTSSVALKRFNSRKPKSGIVTPFKKNEL